MVNQIIIRLYCWCWRLDLSTHCAVNRYCEMVLMLILQLNRRGWSIVKSVLRKIMNMGIIAVLFRRIDWRMFMICWSIKSVNAITSWVISTVSITGSSRCSSSMKQSDGDDQNYADKHYSHHNAAAQNQNCCEVVLQRCNWSWSQSGRRKVRIFTWM